MAAIANPEPKHQFRQTDMELREQQRQQAIRDLEALLQPGALEARIEQVCLKVLIFSEAVFSNREVKRTTFQISVVKVLFTCRFRELSHLLHLLFSFSIVRFFDIRIFDNSIHYTRALSPPFSVHL